MPIPKGSDVQSCTVKGCSNSDHTLVTWELKHCDVHKNKIRMLCPCPRPFSFFSVNIPPNRLKDCGIESNITPATVCSNHFHDGKPTDLQPYPEFVGSKNKSPCPVKKKSQSPIKSSLKTKTKTHTTTTTKPKGPLKKTGPSPVKSSSSPAKLKSPSESSAPTTSKSPVRSSSSPTRFKSIVKSSSITKTKTTAASTLARIKSSLKSRKRSKLKKRAGLKIKAKLRPRVLRDRERKSPSKEQLPSPNPSIDEVPKSNNQEHNPEIKPKEEMFMAPGLKTHCLVCCSGDIFSFQKTVAASPSTSDSMVASWNSEFANALQKEFQLDEESGTLLTNASYCLPCYQRICDVNFLRRTIRTLEERLTTNLSAIESSLIENFNLDLGVDEFCNNKTQSPPISAYSHALKHIGSQLQSRLDNKYNPNPKSDQPISVPGPKSKKIPGPKSKTLLGPKTKTGITQIRTSCSREVQPKRELETYAQDGLEDPVPIITSYMGGYNLESVTPAPATPPPTFCYKLPADVTATRINVPKGSSPSPTPHKPKMVPITINKVNPIMISKVNSTITKTKVNPITMKVKSASGSSRTIALLKAAEQLGKIVNSGGKNHWEDSEMTIRQNISKPGPRRPRILCPPPKSRPPGPKKSGIDCIDIIDLEEIPTPPPPTPPVATSSNIQPTAFEMEEDIQIIAASPPVTPVKSGPIKPTPAAPAFRLSAGALKKYFGCAHCPRVFPTLEQKQDHQDKYHKNPVPAVTEMKRKSGNDDDTDQGTLKCPKLITGI